MAVDHRTPPAVQSQRHNPERFYKDIASSLSQVHPAPPVPPKRYQALPGDSATLPRQTVPTVPPRPRVPLPLQRSHSQQGIYEDLDRDEEVRVSRTQSVRSDLRSSKASKTSSVQLVYLSESMSLSQLVKKYSKSFPIRIAVTTGYLGPTPRLTLSAGDSFNVHFQKRTKVVVIRDAQDSPYSVPLNSVLQFGLIQKNIIAKKGQTSLGLDNLIFETVADVLALPTLPRVIATTVSWRGETEKSSVECNEILIVKHVPKLKILTRARKSLKVFSVLSQSEKSLPENCCGHFSISPNRLLLHLPDLMEHVPNLFPSESIIYCNYRNEGKLKDLPPGFLSRSVTMCECIKEASLVASSVKTSMRLGETGYNPESEALVDIPVDDEALKITVAVVDSSDSQDTEKLYEDTKYIYERFNPRALTSFKDTGSEETYVTQSLFYEAIRPGCEKVGVELEEPSAIYDRIPAHTRLAVAAPSSTASETKVENVVALPKPLPRPPLLRHDSTRGRYGSSPDVGSVSSGYHPGSATVRENSTERLNSLEAEVKQMKEEIGRVNASVLQVTKQSKSLEGRIQALSKSSATTVLPSEGASSTAATADEENREYLRTLDLLQVREIADSFSPKCLECPRA